jgi:CheY-like chemotaxis protein
LDRLPKVERLKACKDWQTDSPNDLLLVALESRVSPECDEVFEALQSKGSIETVSTGQQKKSRKRISTSPTFLDSSISLLLGESWVGHRRTYPIPESINTFYWYELYDRLMPSLDLGIGSTDFESPERGQRIARWHSISEHLAQTDVSRKRVLVVADSDTTHSMWRESLGVRYACVLGVDSEQLDRFRFQPDMVLVDYEPGPSTTERHASESHCLRVIDTLELVRHRFPEAMTVVSSGFPRWVDWEQWSDAGADVLLPKPGCLLGLSWGIKRWEQRQLAE